MEDWKEAIERSKIPRLPWKVLLGKTLTQYVMERKAEGKTKKEVIRELAGILHNNEAYLESLGFSLDKALDNMRISVGARWVESEVEGRIIEKKGYFIYKARVRSFRDGNKFIYFPFREFDVGDIVLIKVRKKKVGRYEKKD